MQRHVPAAVLALGILPAAGVARQDPIAERVDAVFAEFDRPDSPGCAVGVVRDGEFLFKRGYGSATLDWNVPITTTTVFYVGSVSKQFTAAAIALLEHRAALDLDDDIRRFLPEMPGYDRPVTIRHLVHHTSGVRDMYRAMADDGKRVADVFSRDEALALLATLDLDFPPGTRYAYSNGGYFLLSMIVERASGQTLRAFTDEHLFRPLGMHDTHFHDTPDHIVPRRAMSYERRGGGKFRQTYLGNFALPGAGGLYTTVEDLLLWDRNFYDNRLGGGDTFIDGLLRTGALNDGEELDYAFALREATHRGLRTLGHSGSMMGFKAYFVRFPAHRFATWTLCNLGSIDPGELTYQVADIFLNDDYPTGR